MQIPELPSLNALVLLWLLLRMSAESTVSFNSKQLLLQSKTNLCKVSLQWLQQSTTIGKNAQSITPWVKSYWLTLPRRKISGLRLKLLLHVLQTYQRGQTVSLPKREKLSNLTLLAFLRTVSHGGLLTYRKCLLKDKLYPALSLPSRAACSRPLICLLLNQSPPDVGTWLLCPRLEMTRLSLMKSMMRRNLRKSTCAHALVYSPASRYGTENTHLSLAWCMVILTLLTIVTSTFLPMLSRKSMSTSRFLQPRLLAWQLSLSRTQILKWTVKLSQLVTLLLLLQLQMSTLLISILSVYLLVLETDLTSGASSRLRAGMIPLHHRLRIH